MAATVVWCNKCKTAVWAYDQLSDKQDIRGLMNMMGMPCPECGEVANFDGWSGEFDEDTVKMLAGCGKACYDSWSMLHFMFEMNVKDGTWAISPDCAWFRRPGGSDEDYHSLLRGIRNQVEAHSPAKR